MNIQTMKLDSLHPYEKNPRKNDKAVKYVAESIKQFGFKVPIIVDRDFVIVAGHTHVFVADYVELDSRIKAESARMVIDGDTYDVMLIDNPMGMKEGSQLEIYLKYTGGR